jgi:hypothetical protein
MEVKETGWSIPSPVLCSRPVKELLKEGQCRLFTALLFPIVLIAFEIIQSLNRFG